MLTVNSIRSHKASQHDNKTFLCKHCDFKTTGNEQNTQPEK